MKNITLSVDEAVLAAVRRHAAKYDTTINALVREYLTQLARYEQRAKLARQRLRELSDQSPARLGERAWRRDELHDR